MNDDYSSLPGLGAVVLEDSYVLGIEAGPGSLVFRLDLRLTPDHPLHRPPLPHEWACFRHAVLSFPAVRSLVWSDQGTPPARDATGEIDFGSVDTFTRVGSVSCLTGDWGRIEVTSAATPVIRIETD